MVASRLSRSDFGGEAWGPVLGVQASEGHIVTGEGSKRGGESWGGFGPKHTKRY